MNLVRVFTATLTSLLCLVVACRSGDDGQALLREAAGLHEKAVSIEESLRPRVKELSDWKRSLEAAERSLTPEERQLLAGIGSVEKSLEFWRENHVEIPGFEHTSHDHHGHGHDHDHDHGPALELSPEDMLLVQREFRDSLRVLARRVDSLEQSLQTIRN